jgi:hypothetical protein
MAQHILMILPSTKDEKPRMVGPFLTEATATAWAVREGIDQARCVIRPLESPTSLYGYGRHALIPSPRPRKARWPGEPGTIMSDEDAVKIVGQPTDEPERARRITITGEPERVPAGALTGGIKHWVTGEALEAAPHNVLNDADAVATWSGRMAHFGAPTGDGRVLELNGLGSGDWVGHFVRMPVGVWVMVPNVGALPIGLCEQVTVEDGWLLGKGRISIGHLQKAAPELYARAFPSWDTGQLTPEMDVQDIPAAIDVTNGQHTYTAGHPTVSGPWELERVVFGSVPAWPGCAVRFDDVQMKAFPS